MTRTAFLTLTHFFHEDITAEAQKIARATQSLGDSWILCQSSPAEAKELHDTTIPVHYSSTEALHALGFPMIAKTIVPGSSTFSLLHFARQHPEYDYYWVIEFDVRFRGFWKTFFESFKDVSIDLIASHIHRFDEEQYWHFWSLEHPREHIRIEDRIRCFHPIYRISKRAITFLDSMLSQGWKGHSEMLMPTLLHHNGYSIGDFGGNGPFRIKEKKSFYKGTPPTIIGRLDEGTLRWRPGFKRVGMRWNKIYHPVKPRTLSKELSRTSRT
jgi:hypothetical protein